MHLKTSEIDTPILCNDIVIAAKPYLPPQNFEEEVTVAAQILLELASGYPSIRQPIEDTINIYAAMEGVEYTTIGLASTIGLFRSIDRFYNLGGDIRGCLTEIDGIIQGLNIPQKAQDLYECRIKTLKYPLGEFGVSPSHYGAPFLEPVELDHPILRLARQICHLIQSAGEEHRLNHGVTGSRDLQPASLGNITRLITNEFFFYTKDPLHLHEFHYIINAIAKTLATMPDNLHCILGSFAVLTEGGGLINVTPHAESGICPKISCIVKSVTTEVDPRYTYMDSGRILIYPIIDKHNNPESLPRPLPLVTGGECCFTLNKYVLCKIATGAFILSFVEICRDHWEGEALDNLQEYLDDKLIDLFFGNNPEDWQSIPSLCLHTVISNWLAQLKAPSSLVTPTHADPEVSHQGCKNGIDQILKDYPFVFFGTPAHWIALSPYVVESLHSSYSITQIQNYNQWLSLFPSLSPKEKCQLLRSEGFEPITQMVSKTTLFLIARTAQFAEIVEAIADITVLNLSDIPAYSLFYEKQCLLPENSLPKVTTMILANNPGVTSEILEALLASTPNLETLDTSGCPDIDPAYADSVRARLAKPKGYAFTLFQNAADTFSPAPPALSSGPG